MRSWTVANTVSGRRYRSARTVLSPAGVDLSRAENLEFWTLVDTNAIRCDVVNGVDPNGNADGVDESGSDIRGSQNIGLSGGQGAQGLVNAVNNQIQ